MNGWIVRSDARQLPLRDKSVDCVMTSPPYWGLRDYGVTGQIGLEPTPDSYVAAIVAAMEECRRVLRPSGTAWLNLGDSYAGSWSGNSMRPEGGGQRAGGPGFQDLTAGYPARAGNVPSGLKPKDLVGIPWRVAFALQAAGWWLRSDIVWAKPNPMPESVTDRPTRSHEYVFLLSKSERYWYDADALREPHLAESDARMARLRNPGHKYDNGVGWNADRAERWNARAKTLRDPGKRRQAPEPGESNAFHANGRNARSVWTIATQPYSGAHFATFPEELARRCILAGCPQGGTVLDPFAGSGTVGKVAIENGRNAILCDLAYQDLSARRISGLQRPLVDVLT